MSAQTKKTWEHPRAPKPHTTVNHSKNFGRLGTSPYRLYEQLKSSLASQVLAPDAYEAAARKAARMAGV